MRLTHKFLQCFIFGECPTFRGTGALMEKIDIAKAYLRKIKKTKLSGVDGWDDEIDLIV